MNAWCIINVVMMEIAGKNGFLLPEGYGKPEDTIRRFLAMKIEEERFDHWGCLSFSEAMSQIISLSLANKIGEN